MKLKVKKLRDDAQIPKYATEGAACFDLHADQDMLIPGETARTFHTGLAFEIPKGYAMLVYSRSGHGFKHGVRLANCVGVIDSDYRGEVAVRLRNDSEGAVRFYKGDRVAQAMLIAVPKAQLIEVEEVGLTVRGQGGMGSTGQ